MKVTCFNSEDHKDACKQLGMDYAQSITTKLLYTLLYRFHEPYIKKLSTQIQTRKDESIRYEISNIIERAIISLANTQQPVDPDVPNLSVYKSITVDSPIIKQLISEVINKTPILNVPPSPSTSASKPKKRPQVYSGGQNVKLHNKLAHFANKLSVSELRSLKEGIVKVINDSLRANITKYTTADYSMVTNTRDFTLEIHSSVVPDNVFIRMPLTKRIQSMIDIDSGATMKCIVRYNILNVPKVHPKDLPSHVSFDSLGSQQWATPSKYISAMLANNIHTEAFASPFNSLLFDYRDKGCSFCSLFYDTDYIFGSVGSFFSLDLDDESIGNITVNPPFIESTLEQTANFILSYMGRRKRKFSIMFTLPYWQDTAAYQILTKSPFFVREIIKKSGAHSYYDAVKDTYISASFNSAIIILSNDTPYNAQSFVNHLSILT
jgi:hypothetical protein